jgi:hypothetical protein
MSQHDTLRCLAGSSNFWYLALASSPPAGRFFMTKTTTAETHHRWIVFLHIPPASVMPHGCFRPNGQYISHLPIFPHQILGLRPLMSSALTYSAEYINFLCFWSHHLSIHFHFENHQGDTGGRLDHCAAVNGGHDGLVAIWSTCYLFGVYFYYFLSPFLPQKLWQGDICLFHPSSTFVLSFFGLADALLGYLRWC